MHNRPLIGILGGMGTAAGLYFQKIFIETCHENGITGDQNYPEWVYINASQTPDRSAAIQQQGLSPVPHLVHYLRLMKNAGVDFVIVACNTAHKFHGEIFSEVNLPWISLPQETAHYILQEKIQEIGVLATSGTLSSGVYRNAFRHPGILSIEPPIDSEMQEKVMSLIFNPEFGIKSTGLQISDEVEQMLRDVIDELNTPAILAGCTELSMALSAISLNAQIIDPIQIVTQVALDIWQGNRSISPVSS